MDNQKFIDNLHRALEMEEVMASTLIEICRPESLADNIVSKKANFLTEALISIKEDTSRHKQFIQELIQSRS